MTFGVRCGAVIGGQSSARSDRVGIEPGTAPIRPSKLDKKGKVEDNYFQQLPLLTIHTILYSLGVKPSKKFEQSQTTLIDSEN